MIFSSFGLHNSLIIINDISNVNKSQRQPPRNWTIKVYPIEYIEGIQTQGNSENIQTNVDILTNCLN